MSFFFSILFLPTKITHTHTHDPRPLPTTHEILRHSHVLRFEQQACRTGNLPESHATVGKSTAGGIASKGKGMSNMWNKVYVIQSRQIPFYNIIFVLILSSFMYLYLFLSLSLNSPVEGEGPIPKATPERGTFSRLRVYERVGISLVEVYERLRKSVIPVCRKRPKRANRWI